MNAIEPLIVSQQIATFLEQISLETLAEEARASTVLFEIREFVPEPNQVATRNEYGELETLTQTSPDAIQWVAISPFAEADAEAKTKMEAWR